MTVDRTHADVIREALAKLRQPARRILADDHIKWAAALTEEEAAAVVAENVALTERTRQAEQERDEWRETCEVLQSREEMAALFASEKELREDAEAQLAAAEERTRQAEQRWFESKREADRFEIALAAAREERDDAQVARDFLGDKHLKRAMEAEAALAAATERADRAIEAQARNEGDLFRAITAEAQLAAAREALTAAEEDLRSAGDELAAYGKHRSAAVYREAADAAALAAAADTPPQEKDDD